MKNQEIVCKLRQISQNTNVNLPKSIDFEVLDGILRINLSDKGVCANMQSNESAFEGWALCLKAWLPDLIEKVLIYWNPTTQKSDLLHYERFKYRVWKFIRTYDWAENGSLFNMDYYGENLKNWVINFPCDEADKEAQGDEAILERDYIANQKRNYDVIDQQLPVGVFNSVVSKASCVMPRGKSQIDIWALRGDTLHVFELKKPDNIMVGIISELMYYVNIMNDIKNRRIKYPSNAKECEYRNFDVLYNSLNSNKIHFIKGHFLAAKLHPLISPAVITLLNDSHIQKMEHIEYSHIAL